jgi:hypothetical protein
LAKQQACSMTWKCGRSGAPRIDLHDQQQSFHSGFETPPLSVDSDIGCEIGLLNHVFAQVDPSGGLFLNALSIGLYNILVNMVHSILSAACDL